MSTSVTYTTGINRLLIEFIKPRNRLHGLVLSIAVFYWIALAILDSSKPDFFNQDTRILGFIIGSLIISILSWFGFIGFLESDNGKVSIEESNIKDEFKQYIEEFPANNDDKFAFIVFSQLRNRLKKEIDNLSRRANLNLIIGIITTISGVVILASFVLLPNSDAVNVSVIDKAVVNLEVSSALLPALLEYLPKLTLVILIEIFAFFFLKLYKYSLLEVKFFQNEMTNCEMKMIALIVSLNRGETHIEKTISSFSNIERNFILKKGEKTIEIARDEIDNGVINNIIDNATTLASKQK